MTSDPTAAIAYYTKLIGWGTQSFGSARRAALYDVDGEGRPHWWRDEAPGRRCKVGAQPHWLAYITTPDVDKTAAEAKKLGGKVLMGPDPSRRRRFAIVADPDAPCSRHSLRSPRRVLRRCRKWGRTPLVRFPGNELATKDSQAAFRFYKTLFGWKKPARTTWARWGSIACSASEALRTAGCIRRPARPLECRRNGPHDIHVENCDKTAAEATKLGGKVLNGPMDVPGGDRIAQGVDPQGAMFAIHSKTKK